MGKKRAIHEQGHNGVIRSTPVKTADQPGGNAAPADPPPENDFERRPAAFSPATAPLPEPPPAESELPATYGINRVVLLPVAPDRVHIYWEIDHPFPSGSGSREAEEATHLRIHLKRHATGESSEQACSPPVFLEIEVAAETRKCYVSLPEPGQTLSATVGLQTRKGGFLPLAESNRITTPALHPAVKTQPSPANPVEAQRLPQPPNRAIPAAFPEAISRNHPGGFPVAEEIVRRRIAEFYSLIYRADFSPQHESARSPGSPAQHLQQSVLDLTELSEQRFALGTSSAMKNGVSSAPCPSGDG